MIFFRNYRIERLKRRLHILEAEIAESRILEQLTSKGFPAERMMHARELAKLQYDLRKLQEAS